jgi:hypothetical protein
MFLVIVSLTKAVAPKPVFDNIPFLEKKTVIPDELSRIS